MRVYVIAEAGVNHNGSVETAKQMIVAAKQAGCDCVKFQTFKLDQIMTRSAKKADYQINNTGSEESQYEMLKDIALGAEAFAQLQQTCREVGVEFLSTPFDAWSVEVLGDLGLSTWKIPSGEITNEPLLRMIGSRRQKMILSTGMSTMDEVERAVGWLRESGSADITLLHCTSNYPTPPEDVNMRAMLTLRDHFGLPVGYSDHTQGIAIPIMAVAMGACVIEKHFTLDRSMPGPDHKASLEPQELAEMVRSIRAVEKAFGTGEKIPTKAELSTRVAARKSIVLARDVPAGQPLTREDLALKRPGDGLPPFLLHTLVGRSLRRSLPMDSLLREEDLVQ